MATSKFVDFTNVKEGGGNFSKKRLPAGDYLAKITKVEDAEAKDGVFQYLFTIEIKKHPSATYPYYCKLQENQLWKLRNILMAAGKSVPKSKFKVDVSQIVNKLIGVTLDDTEYNDKEQSEITGVFPAAELSDDDDDDTVTDDAEDEDDADAPLEDDEPEEAEEEVEEEEPEAEEEEEVEEGDEWDAITDRLELRKALKRLSPDTKTSTSQTDDDIRDLIRAAAAKKAKPAIKKPTAKKAVDVSDEDLEELDIDAL